ncbi:snRNA-activating protein complex subunit 1 isoform 3-T3 [Rhinophrynus dorsalis]
MSFPGLKVDCETLLSRFQETDSVRFEEFSAIWRDMKFSQIFFGGMRDLERNKFTREAFSVATLYFLPPYTFQIRVGALYLLYGLYNTQLCQPKQKLTFRTQRSRSHHVGKEEFKEARDRVADLVTSETLEEIVNIHEHYRKTKCQISSDKSQPDKALSLVKEDFVESLKNIVTEHQHWKQEKGKPRTRNDEEKGGASQESEGSERAKALARIKAKTYSSVPQAIKSRRHRQVHMASSESDCGNTKSQKRKRARKKNQGKAATSRGAARRKSSSTKNGKMPMIPEEDSSSSSSEEIPIAKRKRAR